ncbi:UDP-N-acetylmuramoyl-L-alanine--D-glutamate ligase [Halorhodospira halochloris]|nr:UDP-N-acetylmuramoyl-L-alanine--D-glutamate ligase [Halorhodospira halochloris]
MDHNSGAGANWSSDAEGALMAGEGHSNNYTAVVGLGVTGLACVRHLRRLGDRVVVLDSRPTPPAKAELQAEHPEVELYCGSLERQLLFNAKRIVVSPGLDLRYGVWAELRGLGRELCGELTLFAEALSASERGGMGERRGPQVVAVTGSNGKSTVVSLLAEMARSAGLKVALGGNLGTPALDLLAAGLPDTFILEVSSFQLETSAGLPVDAAAVLNISPDHMDRYDDLSHYARTKQRLLDKAAVAVINSDDEHVRVMGDEQRQRVLRFSLDDGSADYSCRPTEEGEYLTVGDQQVIAVSDLALAGRANCANALAAMALADACGLPREAQLSGLRSFAGLPHRMERVGEWQGVEWINDSKATNVGAALAALAGVDRQVVLIAGGQAKGADFRPLAHACVEKARALIIFGEDAPVIEAALAGRVPAVRVADLSEAVSSAVELAQPGDCVLLAPACASFDSFSGYEQRGEVFREAVLGEVANHG